MRISETKFAFHLHGGKSMVAFGPRQGKPPALSAVTLDLWLKLDLGTQQSGELVSANGLVLSILSGKVRLVLGGQAYDGNIALKSDAWFNLAVTLGAGVTGAVSFYVDGVLDRTIPLSAPFAGFGPDFAVGSKGNAVEGYVARVVVRNRSLPAVEIPATLNNLDPAAPDLVGAWIADGGAKPQVLNLAPTNMGAEALGANIVSIASPIPEIPGNHLGERHRLIALAKRLNARKLAAQKDQNHTRLRAARKAAHRHRQHGHQHAADVASLSAFSAIYFLSGVRLYQAGRDRASVTTLQQNEPLQCLALDGPGGRLLAATMFAPFSIISMPRAGGFWTTLLNNPAPVLALAYNHLDGSIYFVLAPGKIMYLQKGAATAAQVADLTSGSQRDAWSMQIDPEDSTLIVCNGSCTAVVELPNAPHIKMVEKAANAVAIAFDIKATMLYFADADTGAICAISDRHDDATAIVSAQANCRSLAVDPIQKQLFWTADWPLRPPVASWHADDIAAEDLKEGHIPNALGPAHAGKNHGATIVPIDRPPKPSVASVPKASARRSAFAFNGVDQFIEIPYEPALNGPQFSYAVWVKPEKPSGAFGSVLTSRDNQPASGYMLYLDDQGKWSPWFGPFDPVKLKDSTGYTPHAAKEPVVADQWVRIVVAYDGSAADFYLDGRYLGRTQVAVQPNLRRGLRVGAGATEFAASFDYPFRGQVAELTIWDRPVSAQEVAHDFALTAEHYLLRASVDGGPVCPLFPVPPATALTLDSKAIDAYESLMAQKEALRQKTEDRAQQIKQQHEQAASDVAAAHTRLDQAHQDAAANLAAAKDDALRKRNAKNGELTAARATAQRRQADAQRSAADKRADARQQADDRVNQGHQQAADMKNTANAKLRTAQDERSKY
jgi:hypothetical protein